ncbi:MAG: oxidoreductase [Mycobacterium sp.]|nr:oxidoreductase [Mycobacterium sp.]
MRDPLLSLARVTLKSIWTVSDALRRPLTRPAPAAPLSLTLADRRVVAHDQNVVAFTFTSADGRPLPGWHPGAHLDIHLPSGRVRQYSLCGDPAVRTAYRIAVRRIPDGGGGSIEMHDALSIGSTVTTGGPRNAFPLVVPGHGSPTTRLRFIAGGIGITPILPMLGLADSLGSDWSMIYVGRSADSIPFLDEVRHFGARIQIRTDDTHGIPSADELLGECLDGTTVYACGPAPMLTLIRDRLIGRDNVELHFERFAAPPVVDGAPFDVTVASTKARIAVAADETLLTALQRSGVAAPYSCQQGFCGTCRTRVLKGVVQHRDTLLTGPERDDGVMLTCVSRAEAGSELVLDL